MQGAIARKPAGAKAFPPPSSLMLMSLRGDAEHPGRCCKWGLPPCQPCCVMVHHPNPLRHIHLTGSVNLTDTHRQLVCSIHSCMNMKFMVTEQA